MKILVPVSHLHKVELRASTVSLREDGIMHFDLKAVDEFGVNDVRDILRTVESIGGGKKFCNLVTVNQYVAIHKDARALSAKEEGNLYTIADAMIVNTTAMKLVLNIYMAFDKPIRPTRSFTSESDAIAWLKTFSK
ncbi:MAG: hypothetical protein ACJ77K_00935 [Bacteroidia bacterium]